MLIYLLKQQALVILKHNLFHNPKLIFHEATSHFNLNLNIVADDRLNHAAERESTKSIHRGACLQLNRTVVTNVTK